MSFKFTYFMIITLLAISLIEIKARKFKVVNTRVHKDNYKGRRLIKTDANKPAVPMTQAQIFQLIKEKKGFLDLTKYAKLDKKRPRKMSFPKSRRIKYKDLIRKAISFINQTRMEIFVKKFTEFKNRVYFTESAEEAQDWLANEVFDVIMSHNRSHGTTTIMMTSVLPQQNVIGVWKACDEHLLKEKVILSAHQDNILAQATDTRIYGADDNASGSAVLIEAMRALAESGFRPRKSVEFHWYGLEELGRLGSLGVSENYQYLKVKVHGLLNFDVVGYKYNGSKDEIGIFTDYTNPDLNNFLRKLTDEFLTYKWINRKCGYACSDHASWDIRGFVAGFVGEPKFTPYLHQEKDTYETLHFPQMVEFVKLAIAYAVEMSEPYNEDEKPTHIYCQ